MIQPSLPLSTPTQLSTVRPLPLTDYSRYEQLVAVLLPTSAAPGAAKRPFLSLRRYLPLYEQSLRNPELGPRLSEPAPPFVLRAALGEVIVTDVTNLLAYTALSLALVDDNNGILETTGPSRIAPGETLTYIWRCRYSGIYPIFNRAGFDAVERRTLLGVLMVEPVWAAN